MKTEEPDLPESKFEVAQEIHDLAEKHHVSRKLPPLDISEIYAVIDEWADSSDRHIVFDDVENLISALERAKIIDGDEAISLHARYLRAPDRYYYTQKSVLALKRPDMPGHDWPVNICFPTGKCPGV